MTARLPKVHVFWDDSNIFVSGQRFVERKQGLVSGREVRIHFENLFRLATAGRDVGAGVCVGSIPPELEELWKRLRKTGIEVEVYERGGISGREQAIDQSLQVHMLRAALDVKPPQVAVLLTGDGAGYEGGHGYHADLERMYERGWGIEVLSWMHSCSRALRSWAEKVGIFVPLDDFYQSITFIEGMGAAAPLSLTRRRTVMPRIGATTTPVPGPSPVAAALAVDPQIERMQRYAERLKAKRTKSKERKRSRRR